MKNKNTNNHVLINDLQATELAEIQCPFCSIIYTIHIAMWKVYMRKCHECNKILKIGLFGHYCVQEANDKEKIQYCIDNLIK